VPAYDAGAAFGRIPHSAPGVMPTPPTGDDGMRCGRVLFFAWRRSRRFAKRPGAQIHGYACRTCKTCRRCGSASGVPLPRKEPAAQPYAAPCIPQPLARRRLVSCTPFHSLPRPARACSTSRAAAEMSPPESSPAPSASPRLPEHHAADVVDVAEAGRVLECAQVERQQRFQQLVRQ
jgi:hypothetical protein